MGRTADIYGSARVVESVHFDGRLSSTKSLTPGNYTLVVTAITPGVGSTSKTLKFTISR
jgi:hypothetical protein